MFDKLVVRDEFVRSLLVDGDDKVREREDEVFSACGRRREERDREMMG